MTTHADIFFGIASAGFVVLTILLIILLIYLIGVVRDLRSVSREVRTNLKHNRIYKFLFGTPSKK